MCNLCFSIFKVSVRAVSAILKCGVCVCFLVHDLALKKAVCERVREVFVRAYGGIYVPANCVTISTATKKKLSDQQHGGTFSIPWTNTYLF